MTRKHREFTLEELKEYDGQDGRPAYIALGERVIDVTESKRWPKGEHMKRHHAGNDLTNDIAAAPHDSDLLDRFPMVGLLKQEEEEIGPKLPNWAEKLLTWVPELQRHPHPMLVHFPIVTMILTPVFTVLYLITGIKSFDSTAFHLLGFGTFFILLGVASGFLTWWLNYLARMTLNVLLKIVLSCLLFVIALSAFIWRLTTPDILDILLFDRNMLYLALVLVLFPIVSAIGWFGAELTFPSHRGGRKK